MTLVRESSERNSFVMTQDDREIAHGLDALRAAVALLLCPELPLLAAPSGLLLSVADDGIGSDRSDRGSGGYGDSDLATSSEEDEADRSRLIALVELARKGDTEAFGLLYDHYQGSVYRFLYYRTRSATLAEDLTSETFFRALRSMLSLIHI